MPEPINPKMIRLARESSGLTQAQLAGLLNVTQGKVSKVEAALLDFTEEEVKKLCTALARPRSFFVWTDNIHGLEAYEVFHRKRQQVPLKTLSLVHARMNIRRMQLQRLLQSVEIIGSQFPQMDPDDHGGRVEQIAQLVRSTWRIPPGPIDNLTEALEGAGGIILPFDFGSPKVDAMSQWLPGMPPLFYLNTQFPVDRMRWSTSHELGHIVMHRIVGPETEDEANRFASEFLMPASEIKHQLQNLSLAKLAGLKQYWKVSMQALLKRASDLSAISPRQSRRLWMEISKIGMRREEPYPLPPERPRLYSDIFTFHRASLDYSLEDLAELLGEDNPQAAWKPVGNLSVVA